ncbi:MAG: DUF465 domain-containing protein [Gammaproteobacteria bacterium]|jgi:uncharacterized protein YdcH (DUF465 family)
MFEYESEIVENLLSENEDFKRLFDKHDRLKRRVKEAHSGIEPMDDFSLENIKKEKLLLKDRMAVIIENYRRSHA